MYDAREGLRYQHHPTNRLNRQYSQQAQFLQNGGHSHVAPTGDISLEEEFRYRHYIHPILFSLPPTRNFEKMAARVGGYPGGYVERFVEPYNMDPGVYEPECDWQEEQGAYPDTQQFLQDQIQAMRQQQDNA